MTEAVGMQGFSGEEMMIDPFRAKVDDMLSKLDEIEDAFEKMIWIMMHLMPALTEEKEAKIEGLADDLSEISDLVDEIAQAQKYFNQLKEAADPDVADKLFAHLDALYKAVDEGRFEMDPDIKDQILKSIEWMQNQLGDDCQKAATYVYKLWNETEDVESTLMNGDDGPDIIGAWKPEDMQKFVEEFSTINTSLTSISNVVQTEFQYDANDYETWIGLYKDMFQSFRNQNQTHIDGIKRA